MKENRIDDILNYWFGALLNDEFFPTEKAKMWFNGGEDVNRFIRQNFGDDLDSAIKDDLDAWKESPRGCLALIILLDQFSRNIFGDLPKAFTQDEKALKLAQHCIDQGFDEMLHPAERTFIYIPFEHSEDLEIQRRGVELFTRLAENVKPAIEFPIRNGLDYAEQHMRVIERFGRFPHRNEILGRQPTPEEIDFLKTPGSSF